MRIGVSTPGVMQLPGVAGRWEAGITPAQLAGIAEIADALGYDYLTCAEHVAVPTADRATRGDVYWDPLSTLGFLAARTTRIRLVTAVLVLGYHHPLEIAKRYGTLDRLADGRLVLGVGVGSLEAEFDLLGASFADRGRRADDALRALRTSLSNPEPVYAGEFYRFHGMSVRPCAVSAHVPIWVGGRTRRSLRRAVELGDGWMPFALDAPAVSALLTQFDLPEQFEVVLGTGDGLDALAEPERTREHLTALQAAGATAVTVTLRATSAPHFGEQLSALRGVTDDLKEWP